MTVGTLTKILNAMEKQAEITFCSNDGAGPYRIDRVEINQVGKDDVVQIVLVGELEDGRGAPS